MWQKKNINKKKKKLSLLMSTKLTLYILSNKINMGNKLNFLVLIFLYDNIFFSYMLI